MNVLVVGSGGREHALLLGLAADPSVTELFVAPGNAGTEAIATNHPVDASSGEAVVALARKLDVDLVVIGPEVPLVLGVADALRAAGIATFGPSAAAAQIEGSKAFAKDVMAAAGVRTAHAEVVDNPANLDAALDRFGPTWVVKDDGLAAGKGVVVTTDRAANTTRCNSEPMRAVSRLAPSVRLATIVHSCTSPRRAPTKCAYASTPPVISPARARCSWVPRSLTTPGRAGRPFSRSMVAVSSVYGPEVSYRSR